MARPAPISPPETAFVRFQQWWLGIFFALVFLKFGTPCVMESLVVTPTNGWEWALNGWPIRIAFALLAVAVGVAVVGLRPPVGVPLWLILLPLSWLLWQVVAATQTVDRQLTEATLKHFLGCVVSFYLGLFCIGRWLGSLRFWLPLWIALAFVLIVGFHQHLGGLEATRRYFFAYVYHEMAAVPPEFLHKMASDRIFSTMFYPNTLAGGLLLLTPGVLAITLIRFTRLTTGARCFLGGVLLAGALACLYWSGSKAGWLICLGLVAVALLHLPFNRRVRIGIVFALLLVGLAGFLWKYSGFIQRGAPSAQARVDYWEAALANVRQRPWLGSGPGTFGVVYQNVKHPESEMARLTHNDYLQQASDSGLPGAAMFAVIMLAIVGFGYRGPSGGLNTIHFAVWLGLVGLAVQSFVEFGFYIPAMAWTAWMFGGCLLARRWNAVDRPSAVS